MRSEEKKRPRIISMVPSWTETLIYSGVEVVGRTRFCIHPASKAASIPAVGGTKDINWEKVRALNADFILLDQEENPLSMAEESFLPVVTTHILSVSDVSRDCSKLAQEFNSDQLKLLARRWKKISEPETKLELLPRAKCLSHLPGIIQWINPLRESVTSFIYVIWKKPWMAVSRKTFIGSMFENLGYGEMMLDFEKPYPEVDLENLDPEKVMILFSTEPFPFGKRIEQIKSLPHSSALIDGESYSWFGIRSLEFLENNK